MTDFVEKYWDDKKKEKYFEYIYTKKIPCTEEEKEIYGVDFKSGLNAKAKIYVRKFEDGGEYYEPLVSDFRWAQSKLFNNLDNAKNYIRKNEK